MTNEEVGHLQEAAQKRQERLRELREKMSADSGAKNGESAEQTASLPKPKLRNYAPKNGEEPDRPEVVDLSKHVQQQLAAGRDRSVIAEASLANLAPRKPDWDLKRAVEPKLQKLEKRTRRAITELIRERLQEGSEDLATSVTSGTLVR